VSAARVDFTPEALREIDDAFEWNLERSLQAAEALIREVDGAVAPDRELAHDLALLRGWHAAVRPPQIPL
jgi:plasmid stabilization system protein ParE